MAIHRAASLADIHLPEQAIVVADRGLPDELLSQLEHPVLVDAGESLKTLSSIERLAERVLQRRATRPLTLVAIGGGSVGDAVGFLASILWRGIDLWHVPTTLLSIVDSAHGGKTAVNLGTAKNQLGTFHCATETYLVEEVLATLPLRQREEGLAELIKALWIGDADALDVLDTNGGVSELAAAPFELIGDRLMALIQRAIDVKLAIVEDDPYETRGIRTYLNLGHTVAHALELQCGLSHGHAVAWGLGAAAHLSRATADLAAEHAERLFAQVYPLLHHSRALLQYQHVGEMVTALGRDKKRVQGALRSVVLSEPGRPRVTSEPTPHDWFRALRHTVERWQHSSIAVHFGLARHAELPVAASKSELNRLQVIAHLRPASTQIHGHSTAEDVEALQACLATLGRAGSSECSVDCGQGGTTLRFMLSVAATRPFPTRLYADSRLLERPHTPLIDALREAGAQIHPFTDTLGSGFDVHGWSAAPGEFTVSADESSQFASSLALLSAAGESITLHLTGDLVSAPYFDMTLALLTAAGVTVHRHDNIVRLTPSPALRQPVQLTAEPDASSAAVWAVACFLRPQLGSLHEAVAARQSQDLQPDTQIVEFLQRLGAASTPEPIVFDLTNCPDLAPALTIAALDRTPEVHLIGAAHLRAKESNRIEDFAQSLAHVGITVHPTDDGLRIPPGIQRATPAAPWHSHADHRLAMAGMLLAVTSSGPLTIEEPWVVAKSYPELWHHARRVGWCVGVVR